jgi:DHA2 family multidrug resistance protein
MTPVTLFLLGRVKMKPPILLGIGFLIITIANFMTAGVITTDSTFGTFVFPLVFGGLGFGMLFVPLSVAVLSSVHGPDTQKATSLISLCQQLGGSIATALLVTLLDRRGALHLDALAGTVNLQSTAVANAIGRHAPLSALSGIVNQQAATMAFADAFFFMGIVAAVVIPLVFLMRAPRGTAAPAPAAVHIAME